MFIILVTLSSCGDNIYFIKKRNIKTFDIQQFNRYQSAGGYQYSLPIGLVVKESFLRLNNVYFQRLERDDSLYGECKEYYSDGKLKRHGKTFYGFLMGIHEIYNKRGNKIDEINYEAPFSFSIEDLKSRIYNLSSLDIVADFKKVNLGYAFKNRKFTARSINGEGKSIPLSIPNLTQV